MKHYRANSSKGQMKIQQMAFVLVALMAFLTMAALFYFSIRMNMMKEEAGTLRKEEAREIIKRFSSMPEFKWGAFSCDGCVDMDKLINFKGRKSYEGFFPLDYLAVEVIYPKKTGECTAQNYPNCGKITLVGKEEGFGSLIGSFVSLCRREVGADKGVYTKCEIGKIYAAGKAIEKYE